MRRRYNNDEKSKMIELYNSGLSQSQVAKNLGCSKSCVEKVLHAFNINQRDKAYYAKAFDDVTENRIIEDYYDNRMSIRELAKKYNCSTSPIITLFKRKGLKFNAPSTYHKYSIDEHFFDEIDTEEKAYILGFLYADGGNCSGKTRYIISLVLHPNDVAILERIKFELKMESPITDWKSTKNGKIYKRIQICNKHMVKMLEKYGLVPRKSLIVTYPEWLREDLHRHFLRGLFDGDGSIQSNLNYINFCGSVYIINHIKAMFENKFDASIRVYKNETHHPNFASMFCSNRADMVRILHWMYDDSNIRLERKYQLYLQVKAKYSKYLNDYYNDGLSI